MIERLPGERARKRDWKNEKNLSCNDAFAGCTRREKREATDAKSEAIARVYKRIKSIVERGSGR